MTREMVSNFYKTCIPCETVQDFEKILSDFEKLLTMRRDMKL